MAGYSPLDRLLHRLALQAGPIAELSFDLDQRLVRSEPESIASERHVFVSGLARAGTTMLMRRFYATGLYRSLTYRDMPFVLAPNLWRRLAGTSRRQIAVSERAHGDRILVDADSPESLDEVFWRIFAGEEYIQTTHLKPHSPDAETVGKYVRYVNAILAAQEPRAERYLSKNNNNILRLESIRDAFPNALILIPFRDPLDHAGSLLRQHRQFSALRAEDAFALAYMTWLAHHEFGLAHRPFRFGEGPFVMSAYPIDHIDYWLEVWRETYRWLERTAPEGAVFVCYEDLCSNPEAWAGLARRAGIPAGSDIGPPFRAPSPGQRAAHDKALGETASALYTRLVDRADLAPA